MSDDGSSDGTLAILNTYRKQLGDARFALTRGPQRGFAANFLHLVCHDDVHSDFYAYADQDDIWLDDKLERAVKWLAAVPSGTPALYCSRVMLVDTENTELGFSPLLNRPPSFANALTQNLTGGNTMVFNNALRALIRQAGPNVPAVAHDWWTYLLVTGCGGKVFYDRVPSLRYRQHGSNLMGLDTSGKARLERWRLLWRGRLQRWNEANLAALSQVREALTEESRRIMDAFAQARILPFPVRCVALWRSGVYRQTWLSQLSMIVAFVFKKM